MQDEPGSEEQAAADSDFVQSLERGLSVIRVFDAEHVKLSLSEVAAATGLSRAAARRFLHTLVRLGYMRGNGGRHQRGHARRPAQPGQHRGGPAPPAAHRRRADRTGPGQLTNCVTALPDSRPGQLTN